MQASETHAIDPSAEPLIRLDGVTKAFGRRVALRDLSLQVRRGEIFALLGGNGAGKSTTFALILGHLQPTGGEVFVRGVSVTRDRGRAVRGVGVVLEAPAFYDYLTGWENLCALTSYSGELAAEEILDAAYFVGLEERIHEPARVYSHGMRQRLALALALLPTPDLLLLDEPAEGLDPEGIAGMRRLILRLNRERGITVVIASHLLAEVEQMCDRFAILDEGRVLFEGNWGDPDHDRPRFRLRVDDWPRAVPVLAIVGATRVGEDVVALDRRSDVADLVAALVGAGIRVFAVEPIQRKLAELYLETTAAARERKE